MSDNTPTLRLPTAGGPPPAGPPGGPPRAPSGRSRGPLIAFVLLSVLLVIATGFLVYVLTERANPGPQSSNTPAATATTAPPAVPTTTPPVVPTQPPAPPGAFTVFTVPQTQQCRARDRDRGTVDAQVRWATTNATQVWVAQGTADAVTVGTEQVSLSGNQDSFSNPLPVDCNSDSTTFTMTLVGADGVHVSRTWTVLVAGRRD